MKKIIMSLAFVAAMVVAVSCACNNNSEKAQECAATECADCAGCDKACDKAEPCCDKDGCQEDQCCDKACDKHCDKACEKQCEKQCDKQCDKECDKECEKGCDKHCEKKACCDSTKVDCKKAE